MFIQKIERTVMLIHLKQLSIKGSRNFNYITNQRGMHIEEEHSQTPTKLQKV
jgi:hypothetical protein